MEPVKKYIEFPISKIFKQLFPNEKIVEEFEVNLSSKVYTYMGSIVVVGDYDLNTYETDVIVGEKHIMLDFRRAMERINKIQMRTGRYIMAFVVLCFFLSLHPIGYLFGTVMGIFYLISMKLAMYEFENFGAENINVFNKEWIQKFESKPNFMLEGQTQPGESIELAGYMNKEGLKFGEILPFNAGVLSSSYQLPTNYHWFVFKQVK